MTSKKKTARLSPVSQLQGVLVVLENQKAKSPTAELLLAIREMVSDALAVLQEPDARSENWVNSTEVGATASGTAGLDLSETADVATGINADSVTVANPYQSGLIACC